MPKCLFRVFAFLREQKELRVLVTLIEGRAHGRNIPSHNHTGMSVEVRVGVISNLNVVLIYHSGLQQVKNTANQTFSRTSNLPHSHKALCHSPSC